MGQPRAVERDGIVRVDAARRARCRDGAAGADPNTDSASHAAVSARATPTLVTAAQRRTTLVEPPPPDPLQRMGLAEARPNQPAPPSARARNTPYLPVRRAEQSSLVARSSVPTGASQRGE